MGLLKTGGLISGLQGKIGGLVIVQHKPGLAIVRGRPSRRTQPTEGEKASRQQFARAVAYAKSALVEPESRAAYQAAARLSGRRAYHLALADFLHPPAISDFDLSGYSGTPGEPIRIRATDDFEVRRVQVIVRDLEGAAIEQGTASGPDENGWWTYSSRTQIGSGQTVVLQATAWDRPGNSASKQADHACGPRAF